MHTNLDGGRVQTLTVVPKNIIFGKSCGQRYLRFYMEDNIALKTVYFTFFLFNSSLLYANFILKYKLSTKLEPKIINFNRQKTAPAPPKEVFLLQLKNRCCFIAETL